MSEQPNIFKTILQKWNKKQWLLVLLAGILLLVIAIPTGKKKDDAQVCSDMELRLSQLLEQTEGVGKVHVMISMKKDDEVEGVVVASEGADNPIVVQNITEMVQALFPVDSHKIKVIKRNQTK